VVAEPADLARQHAQPLAALRRLDAEQLLDRHAEREVREDRRVVVEPVGVRDRLVPRSRLALLLEAAVQVADHHVDVDDVLAVELDEELHRAVRGRMRRTHVEQLVLGVEVALEVVLALEGLGREVQRHQFLGPTSGWRRSFG
jgi:hypothetical protein